MEHPTNTSAPATDRRTPWAVSGYYFFSLAGFAIASPYLPLYWKSQGYSGAALGTLLTMMGLGGLLAQAPMGYLSDRGGQRRGLVFAAMSAAALIILAYPLYRAFWMVALATLTLAGMYRSCDALVQALVGDWVAGTAMASTYGRLRMFGSIGWVVSLLVSAQVAFMTDWRLVPGTSWLAPMFAVVAVLWVAAGCSILLARTVPLADRLRVGPWTALKTVARAPGVGRFLVAFALYWTGLQSISAFLSLYLRQMGASHALISTTFVVSAVSETPVIYLAGRWADAWGERKCLAIAFGTLPVRLVLDALAPSPAWLLPTQAMHSVTYGLMMVGSVTYINHRLPASLRASGQGALGAVMGMAATAAPFLGALVANGPNYRAVFAVMAVIVAAGWAVFRGLPDDSPGEMEGEPRDAAART
jgi:PPP family 3-phenylpropionic acid transporter